MTLALLANRGLHKRPGGWSPKQLGTLSLWLDADDATTITTSTGVSQWDDKSGNSRNLIQPTGSNQPTWVKGEQSGRAVARFDGTNHFMYPNPEDVLDILTGGLSVLAAFRPDDTTGRDVLTKTSATVNAAGEWQFATTSGAVFIDTVTVATTATGSATAQTMSWVLDRSNGSTVWRNGTQTDTDTGSPFPNTASLNTTAGIRLGARVNATTNRMKGDIFEVIVSLSTLSTDDRQKVEGYLAHKWGLTSNLPSDHPYKSIAP